MTDTPNTPAIEEGQSRIVSLTNENGETYDFAVLQTFDFDNGVYLLAMSESFPDQVFVIQKEGEDLRLILDAEHLQAIQKHLEQIAASVQTVTVQDEAGQTFTFQIVDQITLNSQVYMLGLDVKGGNELVAFEADGDGVKVVTDQDVLAMLQAEFAATRPQPENLHLTLETESGDKHEFQVVGQFNIEGKEYVLAASTTNQEEIIALAFDGDQLSLISDEAEREKVNKFLAELPPPQKA